MVIQFFSYSLGRSVESTLNSNFSFNWEPLLDKEQPSVSSAICGRKNLRREVRSVIWAELWHYSARNSINNDFRRTRGRIETQKMGKKLFPPSKTHAAAAADDAAFLSAAVQLSWSGHSTSPSNKLLSSVCVCVWVCRTFPLANHFVSDFFWQKIKHFIFRAAIRYFCQLNEKLNSLASICRRPFQLH